VRGTLLASPTCPRAVGRVFVTLKWPGQGFMVAVSEDLGPIKCWNATTCDGWSAARGKTAGTARQAHLTVWLLDVTVAGMPSPEQEALLRLHQNSPNMTLSPSDIRSKSLSHIFADVGQESYQLELMTEKARCSRLAHSVCNVVGEDSEIKIDRLKMRVVAKVSWPVPARAGSGGSSESWNDVGDVGPRRRWNLQAEPLSQWERSLKVLEAEVVHDGIIRDGSVLLSFYAEPSETQMLQEQGQREAGVQEGAVQEDWVRSTEVAAGGHLRADSQSVGEAYGMVAEDIGILLADLMGSEGHGRWPHGRQEVLRDAFADNYTSGFDSCDRGYRWWMAEAASQRSARMCMDRLALLAPRWRCIGAGCSECSGQCAEVVTWELDGAQGRRDPDFLAQDHGHSEVAFEASASLQDFTLLSKDSGLGLYPEGPSLVAIMSAPGPRFQARRAHSQALLASLRIAGILSTAVTVDMVEAGGWLEACVAAPHVGGAGLSDTYFASALNHMHTFMHAVALGFANLVVLEDDMVLKFAAGRTPSLAAHIVLDTLHDAEMDEYDFLSLGGCAGIHPDLANDALIHEYSSLAGTSEAPNGWDPSLYRQLWRVSRGSRCAGAYAVSRKGMLKALLHLPMWCSMDFMLNGAKHAAVKDALRTRVLFLEPALFEEGSKKAMFPTTMAGCEYCT